MARRLVRLSFGPEFVDEHDARVEIALLAGDALIDRVGDDMADAPRVLRPAEELLADELLAGIDIPESEFGPQPAVRAADAADHQSLRIQHAPIVEGRDAVESDRLVDEGRLVDGREQARGAKIACHHVRDLARGLGIDRSVADEVGNGDGQRLNLALGDIELNHRASWTDADQGAARHHKAEGNSAPAASCRDAN